MARDPEVELRDSEQAKPINYRQTGIPASLDNPGVLLTREESPPVTAEQVQAIYQDELGRTGDDSFIQEWVNSGMSLDDIRQAVDQSPEGVNYETTGLAASLNNPGVLPTLAGSPASNSPTFERKGGN
jgi:hypothetical protein